MRKWDTNDRNNHQSLKRFFDSLTRQERELIKGLLSPTQKINELLDLDENDFRRKLQDSLTLSELGKLSDTELKLRGRLMDRNC